MKTEREKKIIVVGSMNMDMTFHMWRVPVEGETVQGISFVKKLGGKGANQAVAAARLGARVVMIGKVGNDLYGELQLEALKKEHIDVQHIARDRREITGVASIWKEINNQNRIVVVPGANNKMEKCSVEHAIESVSSAQVLLTQMEIPLDIVETALQMGRKIGTLNILNPAPAVHLPRRMLDLVDVITPNLSEAQLLSGMAVHDRNSAVEAAKKLLAMGPRAVVVTLGSEGSVLVTRSEIHNIPARKVGAVDSVGAGDAYNGALAYALSMKLSLCDAAIFAGYAASLSVTRCGAQEAMPTMEEVLAFLSQSKEELLYGKIKNTQGAAVS